MIAGWLFRAVERARQASVADHGGIVLYSFSTPDEPPV